MLAGGGFYLLQLEIIDFELQEGSKIESEIQLSLVKNQ